MARVDGLPTYAVVSPVRDEVQHFARTAEAMLDQTYQPQEWIVVDDGSTTAPASLQSATQTRTGGSPLLIRARFMNALAAPRSSRPSSVGAPTCANGQKSR